MKNYSYSLENLIKAIKWGDNLAASELIAQLDTDELSHIISNAYTEDIVLHIAIITNNIVIAEKLLNKVPHLIEQTNKHGKTVLHISPNVQIAQMLLNKKPALIDAVDNYGQTVMHSAPQLAEFWFNQNPDLVFIKDHNGSTALHKCAIGYNTGSMITFLGKQMPQELIDATNDKGETAISLACRHCHAQNMGGAYEELKALLMITSAKPIHDALWQLQEYERQSVIVVIKQVLKSLDQAIELDPHDPSLYLKKGDLLSSYGKNNYEKAIKCYQQSMHLHKYHDELLEKEEIITKYNIFINTAKSQEECNDDYTTIKLMGGMVAYD